MEIVLLQIAEGATSDDHTGNGIIVITFMACTRFTLRTVRLHVRPSQVCFVVELQACHKFITRFSHFSFSRFIKNYIYCYFRNLSLFLQLQETGNKFA